MQRLITRDSPTANKSKALIQIQKRQGNSLTMQSNNHETKAVELVMLCYEGVQQHGLLYIKKKQEVNSGCGAGR